MEPDSPNTPDSVPPAEQVTDNPQPVDDVVDDRRTEPAPDETTSDDEDVELSNGDVLRYDDNGNTIRVDGRTESVHTAHGDYHDVVTALHELYPDRF